MAEPVPQIRIKEVTGPQREIVLGWRCLPKTLKFGGEMRHELTWNPGTPEATLQVLGASEKSLECAGTWRDRHMTGDQPEGVAELNGSQIDSALVLANVVDSIRRGGQIVRFSWHTEVRFGIIGDFEYECEQTTDVNWQLTLVWMSRDRSAPGPVFPARTGIQGLSTQMEGNMQRLVDARTKPAAVILQGQALLGKVDNAIARLGGITSTVKDTAAGYADQVLSPVATLRRALGAAADTLRQSRQMVEELQHTVYTELLGVEDAAKATVGEILATASWVNEIKETGGTFAQQTLDFRDASNERLTGEIQATHICKDGEDLHSISRLYYNTDAGWVRIMEYNQKLGDECAAGEIILIPRNDSLVRQ